MLIVLSCTVSFPLKGLMKKPWSKAGGKEALLLLPLPQASALVLWKTREVLSLRFHLGTVRGNVRKVEKLVSLF